MRIEFNLDDYGISVDEIKQNNLSPKTLDTILSYITNRYIKSEYESVRIMAFRLQSMSGHYLKYIDFLKRKDIIFSDKHYIVGQKSITYYFTDMFKKYAQVKNFISSNKVKKNHPQNYLIPIDRLVLRRLKRDWFNSNYIQKIDVKRNLRINTINLEVYDFKGYISSQYNIHKFMGGDKYFNWRTGRLYTNFTHMQSDIRLNNFIFNLNSTDHLMTKDIKNSFPMFLGVWCLNNGINKYDHDFISYCTDVCNGTIYDTLRENLNKMKDLNQDSGNEESRVEKYYSTAETKIRFQKWLNGVEKNDLINGVFKMYYPEIFELVSNHKISNPIVNKSGKNIVMYVEMIKLETDFVMNNLCKELYGKIPDIELLTCHDQIYYESKYDKQVSDIWDQKINSIKCILPQESFSLIDNDEFLEELDF